MIRCASGEVRGTSHRGASLRSVLTRPRDGSSRSSIEELVGLLVGGPWFCRGSYGFSRALNRCRLTTITRVGEGACPRVYKGTGVAALRGHDDGSRHVFPAGVTGYRISACPRAERGHGHPRRRRRRDIASVHHVSPHVGASRSPTSTGDSHCFLGRATPA